MKNIKNKILDIVENKNLEMIPRWKFFLLTSLAVFGLIFSFLLLLFVISLILFILLKYGFMYLPLFGFGAISHMVTGIPVILAASGLLLVVIVELLSKHFAFSFKKPVMTTLLLIIVSAFVIGFAITLTPFHRVMHGYVRNNHMDGFTRMYERTSSEGGRQGMAVLRGEVVSTTTDTLTLSLFGDALSMVYATSAGEQFTSLGIGDDIVVFGIMSNGRFEVLQIREAPLLPFEKRRAGMMLESGGMQ